MHVSFPCTPLSYRKKNGVNDWSLEKGCHIFVAFRQDYDWLKKQRGIKVWVLKQTFIETDTRFGLAIQAELDGVTNPTAKRWWKTIYQHALGLAAGRANQLSLAYMHCLQKHLMWETRKFLFADGIECEIDCDSLCFFEEEVRDRAYAKLDNTLWRRKNSII